MSLFFNMLATGHSNPLVLTLAGLTAADPITSTILNGGNLPQTSLRVNTDGTLETATGDSGSALSYSQEGSDFVNGGDGTPYEILITAVSETGDAGTVSGSTIGSYVAISTVLTWTWQKDTNVTGVATKTVDVTIREIARTSNSITLSNLALVSECSA